MFVSSIIPTVGRKVLNRAVRSVLEQDFCEADYEIIVVNDSGNPLPDEDWQHSPRVTVIHTARVERCLARNAGAAVARGHYLHFLDDDDWLLPGALNVLWRRIQASDGADWLYAGAVLYDRDDEPLIPLCQRLTPNCFAQVMAGEWIPLQASLINRADFLRVGGFNPLTAGSEDVDLARRMALNHDFLGTDEFVAGIGVGVRGSTTNQAKARLDARRARELILDAPAAFERMWRSAANRFWRGKVVRIYLTSAYQNLQQRRLYAAASRLTAALRAMCMSGLWSIANRDFWRAVATPYDSEAFARGRAAQRLAVPAIRSETMAVKQG
jgi:glycosyltransferase involved in cell wall biosynthesis